MRAYLLAFLCGLLFASPCLAEMVEVAPGITVSRKSYRVPANEQPFFGFSAKSEAERRADLAFVRGIVNLVGAGEAVRESLRRGREALAAGDFATAAKRFNQAFLINPREPDIYRGFAVIVRARFDDKIYSDELSRLAHQLER